MIQSFYPENINLKIDKSFRKSKGKYTNFLDMRLYVTKIPINLTPFSFNPFIGCDNFVSYDYGYIIDSTLHEKPNTLFTYTHKNSNIPLSLKTGTIRGELIRRVKLCSTQSEYNKHKRIYFDRLSKWGYTKHFFGM